MDGTLVGGVLSVMYYGGLPSLPRRCSGLPCLGADAGVFAVGTLGKSQEKQVEQLTVGGQRWAGDCQPGPEFPWPL